MPKTTSVVESGKNMTQYITKPTCIVSDTPEGLLFVNFHIALDKGKQQLE